MGRLRKNVKYENRVLEDKDFFIQNPSSNKGGWKKKIFKNDHELHIEIGCGKGLFVTQKALGNPDINYIAIDKFLTILHSVLVKCKNLDLKNLKIISHCASLLTEIFANGEVDKIYLNFSDPWPKARHENKRLTSLNFLEIFFTILKPGGLIEFKTDNISLFEYTYQLLKDNNFEIKFVSDNIYSNSEFLVNNVQTEYEKKWIEKGVSIKKIIFTK